MKTARASSTAKVIAAATILLDGEKNPDEPVAPGAAELCHIFLSGRTSDRLLAATAAHPLARRFWRMVERIAQPGILAHYWNRKRWIETRCRAAIAEDVESIIVIGAGFDTFAIRLAREFPKLRVAEIDHPATQEAKIHSMVRYGLQCPPNLQFATADLSVAPPDAAHFDSSSTLVIMEGLLMYLSEETVSQLFATLHNAPCRRLRVLFTFMRKRPDGGGNFRPRGRLVGLWLRWRGEPFVWALPPDRMPGWLAERGFQLKEMATTRDLAEREIAPALDGEYAVSCERRDSPPEFFG